jgi:hypothetical protein
VWGVCNGDLLCYSALPLLCNAVSVTEVQINLNLNSNHSTGLT